MISPAAAAWAQLQVAASKLPPSWTHLNGGDQAGDVDAERRLLVMERALGAIDQAHERRRRRAKRQAVMAGDPSQARIHHHQQHLELGLPPRELAMLSDQAELDSTNQRDLNQQQQHRPHQQFKNKKPVNVSISQRTVNGLLALMLLFLVSVSGSLGAILIISSLTVIESLQTRGNCYLVSFALSHLLVTLLVMPTSALQIMAGDGGLDGRRLCHYQWLLLEFTQVVSHLSFLLIAADNYLGYKCSQKVTTTAELAAAAINQHQQQSCSQLEQTWPTSHQKLLEAGLPLRPTAANAESCVGLIGGSAKTSLLQPPRLPNGFIPGSPEVAAVRGKVRSGARWPADCLTYGRCCGGRLRVVLWILAVWLLALLHTLHQHERRYGPKFCTLPAIQQLPPPLGAAPIGANNGQQQQKQHRQQLMNASSWPDGGGERQAHLAERATWARRRRKRSEDGGKLAPFTAAEWEAKEIKIRRATTMGPLSRRPPGRGSHEAPAPPTTANEPTRAGRPAAAPEQSDGNNDMTRMRPDGPPATATAPATETSDSSCHRNNATELGDINLAVGGTPSAADGLEVGRRQFNKAAHLAGATSRAPAHSTFGRRRAASDGGHKHGNSGGARRPPSSEAPASAHYYRSLARDLDGRLMNNNNARRPPLKPPMQIAPPANEAPPAAWPARGEPLPLPLPLPPEGTNAATEANKHSGRRINRAALASRQLPPPSLGQVRPSVNQSAVLAPGELPNQSGSSSSGLWLLRLLLNTLLPSLLSGLLFARAYLRMKEFKLRPQRPLAPRAHQAAAAAGLLSPGSAYHAPARSPRPPTPPISTSSSSPASSSPPTSSPTSDDENQHQDEANQQHQPLQQLHSAPLNNIADQQPASLSHHRRRQHHPPRQQVNQAMSAPAAAAGSHHYNRPASMVLPAAARHQNQLSPQLESPQLFPDSTTQMAAPQRANTPLVPLGRDASYSAPPPPHYEFRRHHNHAQSFHHYGHQHQHHAPQQHQVPQQQQQQHYQQPKQPLGARLATLEAPQVGGLERHRSLPSSSRLHHRQSQQQQQVASNQGEVTAALANVIRSMDDDKPLKATTKKPRKKSQPQAAREKDEQQQQLAQTKTTLCSYAHMTDDQLLKSNIIVFLVNFTLSLPLLALSIAAHYSEQLTQELKDGVWWMATLNCCSCSYVYALTNKDFREAFNKLFYYCCCKSHVTFQRKAPIFRRQLDSDPDGNLRVHIIPGLNLHAPTPRASPQPPVHQHHHHHLPPPPPPTLLDHTGPVDVPLDPPHRQQPNLNRTSAIKNQQPPLARHHHMSVGGGFGGPLFARESRVALARQQPEARQLVGQL